MKPTWINLIHRHRTYVWGFSAYDASRTIIRCIDMNLFTKTEMKTTPSAVTRFCLRTRRRGRSTRQPLISDPLFRDQHFLNPIWYLQVPMEYAIPRFQSLSHWGDGKWWKKNFFSQLFVYSQIYSLLSNQYQHHLFNGSPVAHTNQLSNCFKGLSRNKIFQYGANAPWCKTREGPRDWHQAELLHTIFFSKIDQL